MALGNGVSPQHVLLRATGIRHAFAGHRVLSGVDVELHRGEVAVLRGNNGSGKTTLVNILSGHLQPDGGLIELAVNGYNEQFRFPRAWWRNLSLLDHFAPERAAIEGVGRTWQDIRLFRSLSLRENIAVAHPRQIGERPHWSLLRRMAVRKQEKQNLAEVDRILCDLGLGGRESSSGDQVSLGQTKRVAFARAVRANAGILFLDEPLAGLDAEGVQQVLTLLRDFARQHQVTLLIVEHVFHIRRVLEFADTVWTLANGKVTIQTPEQVQEELRQTADDGLRQWMAEVAGPNGGVTEVQLPGGALLSTVVRPRGARARDVVLELKDLAVHRRKRRIIGWGDDAHTEYLSLALRQGEIGVLQAPNGWGKTTLLDAISGVLKMQDGSVRAGSIRLRGVNLRPLPAWKRTRLGVAFLRDRDSLFPGLTVEETLRLSGRRAVPDSLRGQSREPVANLSGGEKQKLAEACAVRTGSALYLLDEPFSALDAPSTVALTHRLVSLVSDGSAAALIAVPGVVK